MINANDETQWAYLLDPTFELINTAGKPLTGGWINVYVAGTRNKYYCASDFNGTLHPFDIPLDSIGANIVLASPEFRYDVYVYNKYGTLVMSRYNVAPVLGGSVSVSGINDIVSDDGTVTVNQYGETFSLSIADTVSAVSSLQDAVSGLDIRVQDLESAVTGIEASLDGKKDVQAPYNASGTNVQTITSVTQDANGVISVEYSDIQAQNPLTPGQYVTIDDDVISVTGLQPEGDYATEDYVDSAVSGLEPIDITSSDGSIVVSSAVSGSVKVYDISVSGGQPVYFRGGETWVQVNGTTADFSVVKKFDGTVVPSDIVSGTVPLADGLWAWDAIVDIYVGGHVNELVKCGIKGQAVGDGYDPDSETELLIDSTRPGVTNSFTLTGLSRGGPHTRLAFTFTRESASTSTMWVRMRRLSVYQVKGPGVSQPGGGGDYEAGWGIIINGDVISVNNAIIPDIDTVSVMIQEAVSGIPAQVQSDWTEDDSTDPSYIRNKPQEIALVAGENITITASGASAVISSTGGPVSGYVTEQELATVSGDIVGQIPSVEITPTLASGTKIAEYSIDGVSGELFAPEGGSSTVYVDSASVLGGDGSQSDPLTLRYDTNTLDKAVGSTTVTLTAGADGCAVIEANSDLAVYMGSHAVTFNFQGIGLSGSRRYIGMSLTPVGGGDTLYLEASGSINAYSSECTVMIDTREQPDWAIRVQWDSTKSWKIYMNEEEDPWPQIVYTTASTTIPGGSYSLTVKNPLPSINGHFATEALVIDSYGNAAWSDIRTVPNTNVAGQVLKSNTGNTYSWADAVTTVNTSGCIVGDGSTASPVSINIDTETLEVQSVGGTDLPIVNGYAFIAANSDIAKYMRDGNTYHVVTFTMSGFTPAAYSRTVGLTIERPNESYYVPGFSGTLAANATSCTITVDVRDYAEWGSGPFTSDHDWVLYTYEDDESTYPAMPYTSCTHNGPAVTVDKLAVKNPLPASTSADENKVLTVNASGTAEWQPAQGGGSTYTAGEYISIENDEISVTGIDPDSYASRADLEAVSAAIPSGSYDLVAGQNITITASGTDLIISGQQGGTNVSIVPDYNSGTRVAQYSIDGVNGSIYTPTQVNANWNETSSSSKAYIQNKPTIHTYTGASGVAIDANDVVSLDSPVELVPGANITIEVSGASAVISSTGGGGGTTYTAGNMISLTNNAIAVSTTAGITDIQTVASLPANPVSTVLYLIPEA